MKFLRALAVWVASLVTVIWHVQDADAACTVNCVVTVINPNGYNCSPWRIRATGNTCSTCYTHTSIASGSHTAVVDAFDHVYIDYDPGGSCTASSTAQQTAGANGTTTTLNFTLTVNGGLNQTTYCFNWSVYNPAPYPRRWAMARHDTGQIVASGTTGAGATSTGTYCPSDGQKVQLDMTFYNADGTVAGTGTIPTTSDGWYAPGGTPGSNGNQTEGNGDVGSWSNNVPSNLPWNTNGGLALDSTLRIVGEVLHEDVVQGFIDSIRVEQAIQGSEAANTTALGVLHNDLTTVNASVGTVNTTAGQIKTSVDAVNTTAGGITTAVNGLGTKLDTLHTDLGTLNTTDGATWSFLSNVSAHANSDTPLLGGIWNNTSNAIPLGVNGFNGVSNAIGLFKSDAHTDSFNEQNKLDTLNTSVLGVGGKVDAVGGAVNNLQTPLGEMSAKLTQMKTAAEGIWADTTAGRGMWAQETNNTAGLKEYLQDTRPFWNILTNQLGDIADNTNGATVTVSNNVVITNSFSISNNVAVTNIFAPTNNVQVNVSNVFTPTITNLVEVNLSNNWIATVTGVVSTVAGAEAILPSSITTAKANLEGFAFDLAPPDAGPTDPGSLAVSMVGYTWDFNPLTHLGGVFTVARALFTWLLVLGYCGLFLTDIIKFIAIGGSAQQMRGPMSATPIAGDIAMSIARVVITAALLVAIGAFLGLAVYRFTTAFEWAALLGYNPLTSSGTVAQGVALANAFFPFDVLFSVGIAYLVFHGVLAAAGVFYVSIVRALTGG